MTLLIFSFFESKISYRDTPIPFHSYSSTVVYEKGSSKVSLEPGTALELPYSRSRAIGQEVKLGRGTYSGAHTQIFVGDESTRWPMELEVAANRFDRWGKDDFTPASVDDRRNSSGYRMKTWELKLLAGFAQCYRNQLPPNKLPMIPADFAELIIKAGGLTAWINSDEKRLRTFWKIVEDQLKALARRPISHVGMAKKSLKPLVRSRRKSPDR